MKSETALNGALRLSDETGWVWRDGTPAPVRTMYLRDLAPSLRCVTYGNGGTWVEIPRRWRSPGRWPRGVVDPDVVAAIQGLLESDTARDHRLRRDGWTIPIAEWDRAMATPCGVWWDRADEVEILDRARREAR